MNINKKYILVGLILLITAWIGNIYYYQKHILREPLFPKHYYDVKQGMQNFRMYYIDNINSKDNVAYITFPEIGDEHIAVTTRDYNSDNRYYTTKMIDIKMYSSPANEIPEKYRNKVITKAIVGLNSGKKIDVNIGKIYLYSNEFDKWDLDFNSSSGSSDYSGYVSFSSQENLKIYEISSKFPELIDDMLDIQVEKRPLKNVDFPVNVNSGDNFTVSYKLRFKDKDIRKNNVYNFTFDILTENLMGEKGAYPVFVDYWLHSPEDYDIDAMVRERGNM